MADKLDPDEETKAEKGFTSTAEGASTNKPVNVAQEDIRQTPDQFFNPAVEDEKRNVDPPKSHATKGMTVLGFTEASRIENTMEAEERERKRAAKALEKES